MSARMLFKTTGIVVGLFVVLAAAGMVSAANIEEIKIQSTTERLGGTVANNWFQISVKGADIGNVWAQDITTQDWYQLQYSALQGAWVFREDGFATMDDLMVAHPDPTGFYFYFNVNQQAQTYEDVVLLGYARKSPNDFADVIQPLHGDDNVDIATAFDWDFAGYAEQVGMQLINEDTQTVAFGPVIRTDVNNTEWDPGQDLDELTNYRLEVGVWSVVGGGPLVLPTLHGDHFTYIGLFVDSNTVLFTTGAGGGSDVPEPATLLLLGSGLAVAGWVKRRRRA